MEKVAFHSPPAPKVSGLYTGENVDIYGWPIHRTINGTLKNHTCGFLKCVYSYSIDITVGMDMYKTNNAF